MLAFSVDLGYVLSAREELQRTADASAIAACWELGQQFSDRADGTEASLQTRQTAEFYSSQNSVTNQSMTLDLNASNSAEGDVVVAYLSDFYNPATVLDTSNPNIYNAVRVRVRKNSNLNGEVPYFFAKIFGMQGQPLQAEALAGYVRDVAGFETPADGCNVDLLPFALDEDTYAILIANNLIPGDGTVTDNWTWTNVGETWKDGVVTGGSEGEGDGCIEVNLYPDPLSTGQPGNRGTVDIGSSGNSSADIARQILTGISPADFAALTAAGRTLVFDGNTEFDIEGDTGISAGFKDELYAIRGQPRCIPIFRVVNGPGNNAVFTIVKWAGIRIMDVKLTGAASKKYVTIQSAPCVMNGVIPSPTPGTSSHVYSPVVLIE
jgi:hypothetical protein